MLSYSKLAQAGIAAVSYLAKVAPENRNPGSAEIAQSRQLTRATVAKVLTLLSSAGIVSGKSGPLGGYQLSRPASEISLLDIIKVFEDPTERVMCPFGPNWCGTGEKCPMHDSLVNLHDEVLSRLAHETFEKFE